jgi:hypothetical protein
MPDTDQTTNPAEALEGRPAEDTGETGEAGRDAEPRHVDDVYDPSRVEVNRARVQGLGVGQKDLDYQRDPTGDRSAEQYAREPDPGPKRKEH